MDNKKKTRLFVRVLCAILAVIMTLSIVLPMAYATEVEIEPPYINGEGFEYIEQDGEWYLNVTGEAPVVRLTNVPENFGRDNLPIVVANMDTFDVYNLNLLEVTGYVASADLKEGHYVVVSDNYSWLDESDRKWAINDGRAMYFYYGDSVNFDSTKYGLSIFEEDNIIELPLVAYSGTLPAIEAHRTFHLDEMERAYPLDKIFNVDEIIARVENIDLEKSLELGMPVYMNGYTPNDPSYYTNSGSTTNDSTTLTPDILGNLSAAGAIPPVNMSTGTQGNGNEGDTSDVPVANPEIIETKPLPEVEIKEPSATQPDTTDRKNPIEIVGDKIGLETELPTFGEAIKELFSGLWVYALLLLGFGGAYFYLRMKKQQEFSDRAESDFYDETRIE